MFESADKLFLGFITGVIFGFLLQKGRVAKYHVIMSQFLLKDWTVVKIMSTAVAIGAVGIYAMRAMGMIELQVKPAAFAGVVVGALLFGVGIAVFGLCPGTSVAACGEGRRDAMFGIAGMLFGAGVYVALYPQLQTLAKAMGDWGKVTLPQVTQTSPWLWIGALVVAVIAAYAFFERHRRRWAGHPRGAP